MQVKLEPGVKFEFYYKQGMRPERAYHAEVLSDSVTVEWQDEFGAYTSVNYATCDVEFCIRCGFWEVINGFRL